MEYQKLIACHECDLLLRKPSSVRGRRASCSRCGASLPALPGAGLPLDWICAVTLAALVTFCIAQSFPVIELRANGMTSEATLFGAVRSLWSGNMRVVAGMVFCSSILFPLIELLALLYLLVPLCTGKRPPRFDATLRVVQFVRPWGMVEVLMLGVLVTIVKMVSMAEVIPGPGLFALGALTIMLCVVALFDPRGLWAFCDEIGSSRNGGARWSRASPGHGRFAKTLRARGSGSSAAITAQRAGLIGCHACGLVQTRSECHAQRRCARCQHVLHERRPESLTRTISLLLAAALAYIPANLLPIMHASTLGRAEDDTILGGVAYFWSSGDWPLAVVVFVASVLVPMLKLVALTLLAATVRRGSGWAARERAGLYRLVERIGRWSMLDVFVVALTVTLVHFGSFAVITAGPAALAFGAVVILTMLASHQFDPRLIWDNAGQRIRSNDIALAASSVTAHRKS
ncbi:paraquat-inducible protein A [Paraburkholderia caribensis]|uniref:Paraquat-inducible protein A n=1 Tax=Paraburkholderia caribensis TaxID=75105 RepID=A0A9Q6WP02_9BURK|nr:paraquat-inducible protein A [Paraburkholderia caribensis]MCO4876960.1 paraquat-inducible protein A [Paraburkholderia caribensis]PTB30697.1 PqiA protein [Paraburkholderia caribensis]QLB65598.1 PqiA protein [Paraburkholderia caribensis]